MKTVSSGNGKMPLISLLAILSVSLTINLPGLAVSPMLSKLHHIFHSSVFESQLLTSLPNMCMIPVVLIAGKLATATRQTAVLFIGLSLFLIAGIGCFFAESMGVLIILGCLVGIGCGLIVPIAAGAISEWFAGKPRQADLGWKSTASNAMIIIANLYVGWVVVYSWHAAFAVYLVPVIPLALLPFMTRKFIMKHRVVNEPANDSGNTAAASASLHFSGRKSTGMLIRLILLYAILTYSTTSISYYAPFLMDHFGMTTTQVGIMTAMYYLTCSLAGAVVSGMKKFFGRPVIFICLTMCVAGLLVIGLTHSFAIYVIASLVTGFGYGIIQPIIYNKTTYVAPTRALGTRYFGYVLSANYVGIMMVPYIDNFARNLLGSNAPGFEFVFSGIIVGGLLLWAFIERANYIFTVAPGHSAPTPAQVKEQ